MAAVDRSLNISCEPSIDFSPKPFLRNSSPAQTTTTAGQQFIGQANGSDVTQRRATMDIVNIDANGSAGPNPDGERVAASVPVVALGRDAQGQMSPLRGQLSKAMQSPSSGGGLNSGRARIITG